MSSDYRRINAAKGRAVLMANAASRRPPIVVDDNGVAAIPLTKGKVALVDAADVPLVAPYHWKAYKSYNVWYAGTGIRNAKGTRSTLTMHQLILNTPKGQKCDHKDRDGLNNRRLNLRLASSSQNRVNSRTTKATNSGFRGVSYRRHLNRWHATIKFNQKTRWIGSFLDGESAARAYDAKAKELFGEFAVLNFAD